MKNGVGVLHHPHLESLYSQQQFVNWFVSQELANDLMAYDLSRSQMVVPGGPAEIFHSSR